METYVREDGVTCEAVKFVGREDGGADHILDLIKLLHAPGFNSTWEPAKSTDEWEEDEETGEPVEIFEPEHIKTVAGDELYVGDYIVTREGETYIMAGELFESVWSTVLTNNPDDWLWNIRARLPFAKTTGYWYHRNDHDAVSQDGGQTYFRMSERPLYAPYGTVYTSKKVD